MSIKLIFAWYDLWDRPGEAGNVAVAIGWKKMCRMEQHRD